MNNNLTDNIIDDLLRKRPLGPKGIELSYDVAYKYSERRGCYHHALECSHPSYGYTDEGLHTLGLHNEEACKKYVVDRWFLDLDWSERKRKRATVTRRANRLWDRLGPSISRVKSQGSTGIYKISAPYDRRHQRSKGYVYANSHDEATTLAGLFFPKVGGGYKSSFVEICGIEKLAFYNNKIQDKLDARIVELEAEVTRALATVDLIKNQKTTLNVLMGHQVAVNT
jgi:hypothetical protein